MHWCRIHYVPTQENGNDSIYLDDEMIGVFDSNVCHWAWAIDKYRQVFNISHTLVGN